MRSVLATSDWLLRDLKRLPEGTEACREAILLDPNYAAAHINLGLAMSDLSKIEEKLANSHQGPSNIYPEGNAPIAT